MLSMRYLIRLVWIYHVQNKITSSKVSITTHIIRAISRQNIIKATLIQATVAIKITNTIKTILTIKINTILHNINIISQLSKRYKTLRLRQSQKDKPEKS